MIEYIKNFIWAFQNKDTGEALKNKTRDAAWSYFKSQEKLPDNLSRLEFELNTQNLFQNPQIDKWAVYRHMYTNAKFTQIFGANKAKAFADGNELVQFGSYKIFENVAKKIKSGNLKFISKDFDYSPGNHPLDRRMDLKNNAIGREIGWTNKDSNKLLDEVYHALDNNDRVILNQYVNNAEPYNDTPLMKTVWDLADKAYYLKEKYATPQSFSKLTPAKLDELKNPTVQGISGNVSDAAVASMNIVQPQPVVLGANTTSWLGKLGNILSGVGSNKVYPIRAMA